VLGEADTAKYRDAPQNQCVEQRQQASNPGLSGFARTVTGNFLTGPPDALYGPFPDPKKKSMKQALGIDPEHNKNVTNSELCGSCHTVRLAVLHRGKPVGHVYEQTTYPEWAFSDYRTGTTADGPLLQAGGARAQSCQGCHMPNKDPRGDLYRSKIAAIQEYSNFPQAEHTLPPEDIDLPVRSGFGRHTVVGLNVFLLKMAWQFPDILGIRRADPMLSDMGIDSIPNSENAMMDQAINKTASLHVTDIGIEGGTLSARVTVINRVGHKFRQVSVSAARSSNSMFSIRTARRYGRRGAPMAPASLSISTVLRFPASCGGNRTARRASIRTHAFTSRTTRKSVGGIRRRSTRNWFRRLQTWRHPHVARMAGQRGT
jgi:hypothetical protein